MRFAAVLAPFLFLVGCVQSIHPFYTDEQLTFDRNLIGRWTDAEEKCFLDVPEAGANAEDRRYRVGYTDEDGKTGYFIVRLARSGKHLFADVVPDDLTEADGKMYKVMFLPMHTFMLVEVAADKLRVRSMEYKWLQELLKDKPDALEHQLVGGDRIVITASTEKLQAFALQHIDTKDAWGEWSELRRTTNPATQPAK